MRRLHNCIIALLLGCCAPLLIWVGAGSALYRGGNKRNFYKEHSQIRDALLTLTVLQVLYVLMAIMCLSA